ncbi:acetoacetate--CoA ligase [Rhodococcus pseudokoreensis]|uniref:Acetoacetate--CoA ligase n=1 Tax=Rhodococcus pseudokoreensis TaxID=2811421 RepID=A0A974W3I0_9NOCA|nr:acetoacetate--CoA ligase [Rhodococcus pseudokoreensis]QSE90658.1 acetoacetate--CoA ligase [Rhodococcus pseudokoreensis]
MTEGTADRPGPAATADVIWSPNPDTARNSQIERFRNYVNNRHTLALDDYQALWRWSVEDLAGYWSTLAEFYDIQFSSDYTCVLATETMPGAQWFPGGRLNYADQVLRHRASEGSAIVHVAESGDRSEMSWSELHRQVAALARSLRDVGVREGDRVVGYLPNIPQAAVAFLAAAAVGATWAVCGQDFAANGAADRLGQLGPVVLVTADGYEHRGQRYDRRAEVSTLVGLLPTLRAVVTVPTLGLAPREPRDLREISWLDATAGESELSTAQVPFDHPLWVVFTSGTTGKPKGIVHGHGGVLLAHIAQLGLQFDTGPRDRWFWYTTPTWMLWNLNVSTLLLGACLITYAGDATYPEADRLWQVTEDTGATLFGASAGYLGLSETQGLTPRATYGLSALRTVGSTGAPLAESVYGWASAAVGEHIPLVSSTGGTDVVGAFAGGAPTLSVRAGRISAPVLGVALDSWSHDGKPVRDTVGELVITRPMPSMPLRFWNDPGGERLRDSYFSTYPGVWRHGDWVTIWSDDLSMTVHGRSDATLNRGGVRLGSAEINHAAERLPEVLEAMALGIEEPGGGYWMPLFVVLRPGEILTESIRDRLVEQIGSRLSRRHVPDDIVAVDALPHTKTGKMLEIPIKRILQGADPADVVSREAVDDWAALARFTALRRVPNNR